MSEKSKSNGSFLNSLLDSQRPSQVAKGKKTSNKKAPKYSKPIHSISTYFQDNTSTPNKSDESFSSTMSYESVTVLNAEIPELPVMTSVLKSRKEALEEKKALISEIKDVQIKTVLLGIVSDVEKYVEDSDKIMQSHNELIRKHNENSAVIQSSSRSISNLSTGIGKLTDTNNELKDRVQSLEITKECAFDSHFVNIILVDAKDADEIESGTIGPKQKFNKILSTMKIVPPTEVVDAKLINGRKFINGTKKLIKILRVRFSDSVSPGRIFKQIVVHNKELAKTGQNNLVKYYVETPTSKTAWTLKKICYELKNDGVLHGVRSSDRGILVSYKVVDKDDENKTVFRSSVVTCEKDVDELRKQLKVEDAYVSVKDKYSADYWNAAKNRSEMTQKRGRECDELDTVSEPKRLSSNTLNHV